MANDTKMTETNLGPQQLESILELHSEGVIYQRSDGKILLFNKAAQEIFGIGADEAFGRTSTSHDWHLVHEDGSPCPGEEHPSMVTLRTGRAFNGEIRGIARPEHSTTWISINTRPIIRSGQEQPEAVVISFSDITQRKRAEDELKESQARYRAIFETNQAPKLLIDPADGSIVDANQAACDFYGYTLEEIRTKKITDINALPPETVKEEMERAKLKDCLVFCFPHRLKSGEIRNVEVYSGPVSLKGRSLLHSIIIDVTDRKLAEDRLRQNEKDLKESQRIAKLGSWRLDLQTNEVHWTEELYRMYGFDPALPPPPYTEHMKLFTSESWEGFQLPWPKPLKLECHTNSSLRP